MTETLTALLPRLRREFGVRSLAVFGSAARGEAGPRSDIDILVGFEAEACVTLITLARVQTLLAESLGRAVDLVEDHPRLRPAFRETIERDLVRVA